MNQDKEYKQGFSLLTKFDKWHINASNIKTWKLVKSFRLSKVNLWD